jgi:hypothetical protein
MQAVVTIPSEDGEGAEDNNEGGDGDGFDVVEGKGLTKNASTRVTSKEEASTANM